MYMDVVYNFGRGGANYTLRCDPGDRGGRSPRSSLTDSSRRWRARSNAAIIAITCNIFVALHDVRLSVHRVVAHREDVRHADTERFQFDFRRRTTHPALVGIGRKYQRAANAKAVRHIAPHGHARDHAIAPRDFTDDAHDCHPSKIVGTARAVVLFQSPRQYVRINSATVVLRRLAMAFSNPVCLDDDGYIFS